MCKLRQQIRTAVIKILEEEFETNLDLTMPWRYKLRTPRYWDGLQNEIAQFNIKGPVYAGLGAWDEVNGIKISCYGYTSAIVWVNLRCTHLLQPRWELFNRVIKKEFEYANPKFPQNLINFVASELATWVMQNELKQEEERHLERIIP